MKVIPQYKVIGPYNYDKIINNIEEVLWTCVLLPDWLRKRDRGDNECLREYWKYIYLFMYYLFKK